MNRHSEVRDLEVSLEPRLIGLESAKEEDLKVNEEVIWLQVSEKRSGIERVRERDREGEGEIGRERDRETEREGERETCGQYGGNA